MTSLVRLSSRRTLGWRRRRLVGEDRVIVVATHDDRLAPLGDQVLDLGRPQEERRR